MQHGVESTQLGNDSLERDVEIRVSTKLNISEQHTAASKQKWDAGLHSNWMLACINKIITSRDREVIILLYSVLLRPYMEQCVHFWSPLCKRRNRQV